MYVMHTWTLYAWDIYICMKRNEKKHVDAKNAWKTKWKINVQEKYVICVWYDYMNCMYTYKCMSALWCKCEW